VQIGYFWHASNATEIYRTEDSQGQILYSDVATSESDTIIVPTETYRYQYKVVSVIDGDTIILENDERVRLLGINTPEIENRYHQGEPGGEKAKKWLVTQIQGKQAYLEYDIEQRDKYKRLLAHVFLEDGEHLNIALLEAGLATLSLIPPNLRYAQQMINAQQQAESDDIGIWSMSEYQPRPITRMSKKSRGWNRYQGEPKSIKRSRKYVRLIFNDKVDVRIPIKNLYLFPKMESYLGKQIEVRGWASRQKAHYSILIRHPSVLIVL